MSGAPVAKRRRSGGPVQVFGELMLTLGVVLLLFVFYEAYWTNLAAGRAQNRVASDMQDRWNQRQHHETQLGEAFARIYVPSFGSDFAFAIVQGTTDEDLNAGPGHYVDSQMPGEAGNFAVAGHRVGKGAPFNDLGELQACDAVVVETSTAWEVYRVLPLAASGSERTAQAEQCLSPEQVERFDGGDYSDVVGQVITTPDDVAAIHPRPNKPEVEADDSLEPIITLTTCHPQFSNAERMVVHGVLTETIEKDGSDTRPSVLQEA